MNQKRELQIAKDQKEVLDALESSPDEESQVEIISVLGLDNSNSSARNLIDIYNYFPWQSTQLAVIRSLGSVASDRAVEFLIHLALNEDDLAQAGEALLSLGETDKPVAGAFLTSVIRNASFPLKREALIGLSRMLIFPYEPDLEAILEDGTNMDQPTFFQYILIALARRCSPAVTNAINTLLADGQSKTNSAVTNTLILCAGEVGDTETLDILEKMDTRYRFFADHLRRAAIQQIYRIESQSINEQLTKVQASKDFSGMFAEALFLRRLSPPSLDEKALDLDFDPLNKAIVMLNSGIFSEKDMSNFVLESLDKLPENLLCALILKATKADKKLTAKLAKNMSTDQKLQIFSQIQVPEAFKILKELIVAKSSLETKTRAINGLVAQGLMSGLPSKSVNTLGTFLAAQLRIEQDSQIKHRLVRAIGQIGYSDGSLKKDLRSILDGSESERSSGYVALSKMQSEMACKILLERLLALDLNQQDQLVDANRILKALEPYRLPILKDIAPISCHWKALDQASLLKILSHVPIPKFAPLIEAAIKSPSFKKVLLGLAAGKMNGTSAIWEACHEVIDKKSPHPVLFSRAVESLCHAEVYHQSRLLRLLAPEEEPTKDLMVKVFSNLKLNQNADNSSILDRLIKYKSSAPAIFHDPEVAELMTNLIDNLILIEDQRKSSLTQTPHSASHDQIDEIDLRLKESIGHYDKLSDTVLAVLRNAELAFQYPELFHEGVDKSTVIVQFVKSIDILLQEVIGTRIFLGHNKTRTQIQSRVIELGLDDETNSHRDLIHILQLDGHRTIEAFPFSKTIKMCQSIKSGRFFGKQYHAVDGLRAWAILLLIFGRTFQSGSRRMDPILPVTKHNNLNILSISSEMNYLQNSRNLAAHRGTFLGHEEIESMRSKAFAVLDKLVETLAQ